MLKQVICDTLSFTAFILGVYGMILFWDYLLRVV